MSADNINDQFLAAMEPSSDLQKEQNFDLVRVSLMDNKHLVQGHLVQQGALLLRNFPIKNTQQAEELLRELGVKFDTEYLAGASPRSQISDNFYTSTQAREPLIISFHTEMCYLRHRPGKVFFYCQSPPEIYGETPIFDCAATYAALPDGLQEKVEELGLMYQRYFGAKPAKESMYKTWMDAFNAGSREEVAKACALQRMTFEWQSDGGLLTRSKTPGVLAHPVTGEKCLSLTLYNSHTASYDMHRFKHRYKPFQRFLLTRVINYHYSKEHVFLKTLWGDGSEISKEETRQILDAAWDTATLFQWQQGDLLLLDNIRCGHGRLNVEGKRLIAAALGDPYKAV